MITVEIVINQSIYTCLEFWYWSTDWYFDIEAAGGSVVGGRVIGLLHCSGVAGSGLGQAVCYQCVTVISGYSWLFGAVLRDTLLEKP